MQFIRGERWFGRKRSKKHEFPNEINGKANLNGAIFISVNLLHTLSGGQKENSEKMDMDLKTWSQKSRESADNFFLSSTALLMSWSKLT